MQPDIYAKSAELLEQIANSIYDRTPHSQTPLFFSLREIHIVEKFLKELIDKNK